MQKVVFFNTEDHSEVLLEQKMGEGRGLELILCNDQSKEDIVKFCGDADGIITLYDQFTPSVISKLPHCKVIAVQGIGYNNIDLRSATEAGICVTNIPDYCLYDVAVHTVALTLACTRHIVPLNNRVKTGKWGYAGHVMHRLEGQVFGMVAFGNIPQAAVSMLKGFGMKFLAYDPWATDDVLAKYSVARASSLDELLAHSDYVSIHCPLNDNTAGLIGKDAIAKMKPGAFLINTARGRIVDESALLDALKSGVIAGAALDVLAAEKDGDNPLYGLDNCIVTPHTAFYSEQSLVEMRYKAMEQVITVLADGQAPKNLVNKDVLGRARFEQK